MNARLLVILAVAALAALRFAPAAADPVGDLNAADVPVRDQSVETRTPALKDALAQVLVKMTGSQAVLETAEVRALLDNPSRFLQQYRYEPIRPVPVDPAALRLALHAEFDAAALERQLRSAGLPLWGRERPLTLAWIALDADASRELLGANTPHPLVDAARRAANRRGLPLALPALDQEDLTRVSFIDVWGVFEEPLLAAASRYAPDAVLVGGVFRAGDQLWAGRWTLLRDGERQRFELNAASPEGVVTAAMDALAEHYAREFAVQASADGAGRAMIEIVDVEQIRGYARVQSYLAALSMVNDVQLLAMHGDTLRFDLGLNGSVRALEQAIALGRVLEPLPREEQVIPLGAAPVVEPQPVEPATEPAGETVPAGDASITASAPATQAPLLRYRYRGQ